MNPITIPEKELKKVIKEGVREAFAQEMMKARALLIATISEKEQSDINKRYGKPRRKVAKSVTLEV